jgi:hypothetical protein
MSAKIEAEEKHIELLSEILEIHLTPELVERMDVVVELLGLESKEDLVHCTIRNMWTDIEWMDDLVNIVSPDSKIKSR